MAAGKRLFMYQSQKSEELFCFCPDAKGAGLPESLAPWKALGVLRPDQAPPHGMSRKAIETGISANGYQLWRQKTKSQPHTARKI